MKQLQKGGDNVMARALIALFLGFAFSAPPSDDRFEPAATEYEASSSDYEDDEDSCHFFAYSSTRAPCNAVLNISEQGGHLFSRIPSEISPRAPPQG